MAPGPPPSALAEADIITFLLGIIKAKDTVVNYKTLEEELGITTNATKKRLKRIEAKYGKKTDNNSGTKDKAKDEEDDNNGNITEAATSADASTAPAKPEAAKKRQRSSPPTIKEPGTPTPAARKKARKGAGDEDVKKENE